DKGESWTEALGTLSRVWGNKQKRHEKGVGSGFTTATIENRNVMLVTLPVYSKPEKDKEGNGKGRLHLWLTDNTHIVDIGPVSGEGDDEDEVTASSLLYKSGKDNKEDELIALYEKKLIQPYEKKSPKPYEKEENKKNEGTREASLGMVSVRLTEHLKRVKEVLKTWEKVDKRVSQLCSSLLAQKVTSPENVCRTVKLTDGLVGFLSGNFSENTWKDEYLGVNATVHNKERAQKADNGVKFTGRGAGAEWPVGKQGENQLYHFANYNFTLVATVSIDGVPTQEGSIPLMGVRAGSEGGTKLMELSHNKENKWHLVCGNGKK
ncbi:trans-sialidase, putative, partial [Trypanosoma cruzi marinkellei]